MDEEHDYESLGSNSTVLQNALAGAFAGIGEHCLMYPIDSIKVCSSLSNKAAQAYYNCLSFATARSLTSANDLRIPLC